MQNIFITEEDVFEIIIFVAVDDNGTVYCDKTEEAVKFLLGEREVEIQSYSITFKQPSFGDIITLTDIVVENASQSTVNPLSAKLKAMSFLLKDWSFVDKDGIKMPTTEASFRNFSPIIAASISLQFDEALDKSGEKKNDPEETGGHS